MNIVGFDDGYFNNKIYLGNGEFSIFPTRAKVGNAGTYGMSGKVLDIGTYKTKSPLKNLGDVTVSVGEDLQDYDSTDFPEYPLSPINRVMVQHVLAKLKKNNGVNLVTGLPVEVYYSGRNFSVNEEFIEKKQKNLAVPVFTSDDDTTPLVTIESQIVLPEAFAGHYDFVFEETPEGILVNEERAETSNVYVDFGGRTTDIALIDNNSIIREQSGRKVSGSLSVGMINYRDKVVESVGETFDIDHADLPIKSINEILTGVFSFRGQKHDIQELLKTAKTDVATVIVNDIHKRLKDAVGIDNMIFIGGGAEFFKDEILSIYPQAYFPENAILANARGMYKYMNYSLTD